MQTLMLLHSKNNYSVREILGLHVCEDDGLWVLACALEIFIKNVGFYLRIYTALIILEVSGRFRKAGEIRSIPG